MPSIFEPGKVQGQFTIGCDENETKFKSMCEHWSNGQEKIWQDWNNYVKYKREKPSKLAGDVVHEAMIQYHLRQQGVE